MWHEKKTEKKRSWIRIWNFGKNCAHVSSLRKVVLTSPFGSDMAHNKSDATTEQT